MHLIVKLIQWIFSLHQLTWFIVGGLVFSTVAYSYIKLKAKGYFTKSGFTFIILSALTLAFTVLWVQASYIESETRAANMGLFVFGGLGIIFAIIAYRLMSGRSESKIQDNSNVDAGARG